MKKILALTPPDDHAERAIALAGEICRRTGARLSLLRVLEERSDWPEVRNHQSGRTSLEKILIEAERAQLEQATERFAPGVEDIEIDVVWGVPWEAAIARVEAEGFDLVIKPAWGLTPNRRVFFGLTALQLFRRCPCPVWVVGDHGRMPKRILAAIDPTPGAQRSQVAARIFEWSKRVASLDPNAHVEAATTWYAPGAALMRRDLPGPEADEYIQDVRRRAELALGQVLEASRVSLPPEHVHFVEGPTRERLPRLIEEEDFDLVVMGTLGREGVVGELLGETAEWILRGVRCSVLTIPPLRDGGAREV